jgi:glycine/D-amino acid oxidase-like deaminating enzyme
MSDMSVAPAGVSLWHDTLTGPPPSDGVLPGPLDVDVAIVGAGFTGLWTAYYLSERRPDLRVVVLDAHTIGFGASGRNGGWCSAIMPMSLTGLAHRHGRDAAIAMQRVMNDTVGEVGRVVDIEGLDCGFAHGGYMMMARNRPQVQRVHEHLAEMERFGFGDDHHRWTPAHDARTLVGATDLLGGAFTPHCAALHPARLAAGLADVVRARGVVVHDRTRVTEIAPRRVTTERGVVSAKFVVRATEGWTSTLPGHRRDLIPIYSLMIATEPLSAAQWEAIGLETRPTFNDARHLVIYGQRTADGRLAFGGRGAPYHFGSGISPAHDVDDSVHTALVATLVELFPILRGVTITHRWGGPLGVPRDWHASAGLDARTGLAWAGGYVGDGVATANLAGRTLADLITGQDTQLVTLPWVGHRSRRWEPEPVRWAAVNAGLALPASIDDREERTGRTPRVRSWMLSKLVGH